MSIRLGKMQFLIMQVLWTSREASARQITDELNASQKRPIAHSTIQTLLRKLEAKRAVAHREHDRTFIFRPLIEQEHATRSAARDLIDRAFAGSAAGLIAHLLREEKIPAAELQQLRKLLNQHKGSRHKESSDDR
jgi:BlaI family penicillinase repressor